MSDTSRPRPTPATTADHPTPAPVSRRERLREETLREITTAAREQVRREGPAGLSLRAVAREVGMSSPGLYRYFASRDDLLTALVAEAFLDLGRALTAARDGVGPQLADRLRAVALAYYDWAEADPAQWSLAFGAPVPDYAAPADGPTTAAARGFGSVFLALVAEAWSERGGPGGRPQGEGDAERPVALELVPGGNQHFAGLGAPEDPAFYAAAARLWTRLHGVIALGLFGHLLPTTLAPGAVRALYEAEVDDQLRMLGLE